jgi:multimeric flavodoxin WrbA
MARVLGIVGSPRENGNTHVLVSHILDGAREAGATTEIVLLGDLKIAECDGCHACWHASLAGRSAGWDRDRGRPTHAGVQSDAPPAPHSLEGA